MSRPQKTSSPTFHTPFCRTAVPLLAVDCPAAPMSYFTLACVAEFSVTELTLVVTAAASGLDEKDLMADAKVCPF